MLTGASGFLPIQLHARFLAKASPPGSTLAIQSVEYAALDVVGRSSLALGELSSLEPRIGAQP